MQWIKHLEGVAQPIHVIPHNDWRDHIASHACWCHPEFDVESPNICVHNSMDGREAFEEGERKPS